MRALWWALLACASPAPRAAPKPAAPPPLGVAALPRATSTDAEAAPAAGPAVWTLRPPLEVPGRLVRGFSPTAVGDPGHPGVDWAAPEGTPVRAAADGVVVEAGAAAPFMCPRDGRTVTDQLTVRLGHALGGERAETVYTHLSRVDVLAGDRVRAGAVVGRVGSTGCATRPHLHFAVLRGEGLSVLEAVDPVPLLTSSAADSHGAGAPP